MTRWVDSIPPVTVEIGCGGGLHRITWARGKVVLHDHALRDEEALLALGGDPPTCVAVLIAWRDRTGWEAALRPHPAGFVRRTRTPSLPAPLAGVRRLGVLRRWDRAWQRRRGACEEAEDLYRHLKREATPRLRGALDAARTRLGGGPAAYVEVRLAPFGHPAAVHGRVDGRRSFVVATLRPEWLYAVAPAVEDGAEGFPLGDGTVLAWRPARDGWEAYAS